MEINNCSKLKIPLSILIPIINFGFRRLFKSGQYIEKKNQWICWTVWNPFWLVFLIFLFRGCYWLIRLFASWVLFTGYTATGVSYSIPFFRAHPQKSKQIRSCTWSVSHLTMDAEKLSSNTHNMTCQKTRWSEIEWIM